MKKQLSKLLTVFSLIVLSVEATAAQPGPKFSAAQLQADYELFVRALKEAHPGLYRYTSKAEMDSLFQRTKLSIKDSMTEEEFYKLTAPLVAKIRCGHTKWFRKDRPDDRYAFYDT